MVEELDFVLMNLLHLTGENPAVACELKRIKKRHKNLIRFKEIERDNARCMPSYTTYYFHFIQVISLGGHLYRRQGIIYIESLIHQSFSFDIQFKWIAALCVKKTT